MPDLSPERVAELERLLELATPRPWSSARDHPLHHSGPIVLADGLTPGSVFVAECAWDASTLSDPELIVAAVNALPALLTERETLRAENERLREMLAWAKSALQKVVAGKPHRAIPELFSAIDAALAAPTEGDTDG